MEIEIKNNIFCENISFFHKLLCAVFPEMCPYCNCVIEPGKIACDKCFSKFTKIDFVSRAKYGYICVSRFPYDNLFRNCVMNLKSLKGKQHIFQIVPLLRDEVLLQYKDIEFDMVTCVPMHKKDLKDRGFNQSKLLAIELSKQIGVNFCETLYKSKLTKSQHTLNRKERMKNLENVYKPIDKSAVKGKTILICDDVITTGSTLGECCKALEEAGASNIFCITLCKTFIT